MSDQDFDFRRAAERREPKQFQPPPWEEDAFRRVQEEKGAADSEQAKVDVGADERGDGEAASQMTKTAVQSPRPNAGTDEKLNEAVMIELLAGLSAEDPPAVRSLFKVAIGAAMVLFAIGGVLIVWAMAALVGARATGSFGVMAAFTLAGFGVGFIAAGWWLLHRTLKRRGVR